MQLCPKPTAKPPSTSTHPVGPSSHVRIRRITEPTHPAFGQFGLFANQTLLPGQWVLDYLGHVHASSDADPESDYDLSLDRELGVGVDARWMGNEARFINDYRGVASRLKAGKGSPNVSFSERIVDGTGERRVCVVVGKEKVKRGDELCVSYGKGFWKERGVEFEKS